MTKLVAYLLQTHGLVPDTDVYTHQTDAFKEWANALTQYQRLVAEGYTPYMVMANGLFKVPLGAFREKANAERLASELNNKGYITWITTKAGIPVNMVA